jgi:ankyrin repeat protein
MRYSVALLAAVAAFGLCGCPGKSKKTSSPAPAELEMRAAGPGGPPPDSAARGGSSDSAGVVAKHAMSLEEAKAGGRIDVVTRQVLPNIKLPNGHTPLTLNVLTCNWKNAWKLLDDGADANCHVPGGLPPLILQAVSNRCSGDRTNQLEFVKKLVEKGASVDATDDSGKTALMTATMNRDKQMVEVLLGKDANVNLADTVGNTPLTWAVMQGDWAIASMLLDRGADVTCPVPAGLPPLIVQAVRATKPGHKDEQRVFLVKLIDKLVEKGVSVDATDKSGTTALMTAVACGNKDAVTLLLENGADVNLADKVGHTPLTRAVTAGTVGTLSIIKTLLEQGKADINRPGPDGSTAVMIATMKRQSNAHFPVILTKLLDRGADVNLADAKGRTALMMAAANNDIDAFSKLISRGASADKRDITGRTALDLVPSGVSSARREFFAASARKVTFKRLNPKPSDESEDGDSV